MNVVWVVRVLIVVLGLNVSCVGVEATLTVYLRPLIYCFVTPSICCCYGGLTSVTMASIYLVLWPKHSIQPFCSETTTPLGN